MSAVVGEEAFREGLLADAERHHRHQTDALRMYINDVLTSLPVGVATVEGTTFKHQNPAAKILVPTQEDAATLPSALGYHELTVDARPLAIHRSPLHGSDGTHVGQVVVLEDISEQRRLAEHVRRAERMAALGQLAGGLAHEVRNPLAGLRASLQVLDGRFNEARDHQIVAAMIQRIDALNDKVEDLLFYARPKAPRLQAVDVDGLLREVAQSAQLATAGHVARVGTSGGPLSVRADPDMLRSALLNLANGGQSWRENGITYDRVIARIAPPIRAGCPALWEYMAAQLADARRSGWFGTDERLPNPGREES